MRLKEGSIYIKAENFPEKVMTCFSSMLGGTGTGEYKGMNPDPRRPWPLDIVAANAAKLGEAAGFRAEDMYMINQVHGDNIKKVTYDERGTGLIRPIEVEADALVTDEPGVALTIFTADCTPILLCDPVRRVVAAVHAGWKSTALDIAGKTVRKMQEEYGSDPSDIHAAIGPCISKCCFETHADVPEAMIEKLGDIVKCAVTEKAAAPDEEKKFFVDLKMINKLLLERAGVAEDNIEVSSHCTMCEPEYFWSHRRMGVSRGSLAAVIMLEE